MRRISWRTDHCPILQPGGTAFIELFPDLPAETLFRDAFVTHSPELDPLAASTLADVLEWQMQGNWHHRQPRPEGR